MPTFAAWIGTLAWPVVGRILSALGVGIVSYAGVAVALTALTDAVRASASGVTGDMAAYLAIAGVFESMAILLGGLAASVALVALKRFAIQT